MPIYEYHCQDCRRRVSVLVRSISNPGTPVCPRCGGRHLERLMSRFARVRSEESRLDALADPGALNSFLQTIINAVSTVVGVGAEVLDALRDAAGETSLLVALLAALLSLAVLWIAVVWTLAGGSKGLSWRQKS